MSMPTSRRQFLKGLGLAILAGGGAAAFLQRQWEASRTRLINRSPSMGLGHRLRDVKPFPSPCHRARKRIVIIGGGVAGLSAAWWLHRSGVSLNDIQLLELEPDVGGNARSGKNDVSAYPLGAHYLPIPNPESYWVRLLLEELGVITGYAKNGLPQYHDEYICHDPQERLLKDGLWQDGLVPQRGLNDAEKEDFKRFFKTLHDLRERKGQDDRPAFAIPLDLSSRDPQLLQLDKMTMGEWLRENHYTSPALRWYVNYCCRDDYGSTLDTVSAWAGLHYFAGRRGTGDNTEPNAVLTWPGGNAWLVQKLRDRVASSIKTQAVVTRVAATNASHVDVEYWNPVNNETHLLSADHVIWAAPRFVATHVIQNNNATQTGSHQAHNSLEQQMTYSPWLVANLTLSRAGHEFLESDGAPLSWDNVSMLSPSLGYVVATHQTIRNYAGKTVITYYYPLSGHPAKQARELAYKRSNNDWEALIRADLEKTHPGLGAEIEEMALCVWGHGMITPTPGYLWGAFRQSLLQPMGRIHFAHSDMSGISNFEEAQYRGVKAAIAILESHAK